MATLNALDFIVFGMGLLILITWLYFYFTGKQHEAMFVELDSKDFPMGELYFVGYAITLFLKLEYKDRQSRRLRKQLSVLYDPRFTEYYVRVIHSMQFTMALTISAFAAPLYFISGNPLLFFVLLAGSGGVYYYYGVSLRQQMEKRAEEVLLDFSEVVSKLALLVNAGMIVSDAWERVSRSGTRILYQEMQRSVDEIHNGKSFADALFVFSQRSMLPEIKKFATTLIQGVSQGNRDLSPMLAQQSKEVWDLKRQLVRRQGELANNKLLVPMVVTFIGIMIMIVVPIFSNIGGV